MGVAEKKLLVTGMHRSGTTFLGKVVSSNPTVYSIHEPYNRSYGIRGVEHVYVSEKDESFLGSIADVEALKYASVKINNEAMGLKKIARFMFGGKIAYEKYQAKLESYFLGKDVMLIKDPFLLLASQYLAAERDYKVVVTCRHPVAVWGSIERMGWKFSFENFPKNEFDARGINWREANYEKNELRKFCYLYNALHQKILSFNHPNILIIQHEAFCLDPMTVARSVCEHFDVEFCDVVANAVARGTEGSKTEFKNGLQHNFERNSAELAWAWTKKNPIYEDEIQNICGPTVAQLYGKWRPIEC